MTLPLLVEKIWPPLTIIKNCAPSLRAWGSANKREASPLCLKLLTTVCNSRYPGVMVLGESAQPWGRILWRCRAEQWLFRLLHSSRRRHICKGRGKNPHFRTFLSYKAHLNTIDLTPNILLFFVSLALLQSIYWGSKVQLCSSFGICVRNYLHCLLRIITRMTPTSKQIFNFWETKYHVSIGPLVHFKVFFNLSILLLDLYDSGVCLLTCWRHCGKKQRQTWCKCEKQPLGALVSILLI